ncbi:FadR/GntR family transcriptional regulator [Thalassorhabdus alkalitolerans]|uniref:FadR/GntR family transcriptional regulator n=1 Tax=Thalassorhabdus alkalitolerans TaxID=2282697 RepID=A0ABW0YKZ3_9BACI
MKEVEIKSIDRKTLSKQVIDEIIGLLTSGQLKPGDRLPSEMDLMNRFNVSRPVMREALTSLEAIGVVKRETRNGTFFSQKIGSKPFTMMLALSAGNLKSLMETRISLELGLVTLAAENITDDSLKKLEHTISLMTNCPEDYRAYDREFHAIIAHSASNPLLEAIVESLLNLFDKTWDQISNEHRDPSGTLQQHIDIFEALQKRDPFEAYKCMYKHLDHVRKRAYATEESSSEEE